MSRGALLIVPTERHVEAELTRAERPRDVRSRWGFVASATAALLPDVAIASPHAARLAAQMALETLPPDRLRRPAEPGARVALAFAFDRALGRFRRAGTTPAELRALGAPSATAVADVLERADAILRRARRSDGRGAGFVLARALRGAHPEDAGVPGDVTVRGIAAWEADDLAWIEALHATARAAGGRGVTIELPAIRGDADAPDPVADALEQRWASLPDAPEIAWVQVGAPRPLAVVSARTAEGEARAAAAEVVAALARGTPPERIAVVVPALDDAALEPLRAALSDAGVRFAEPRGRAAASCPDGRAALALLRLAIGPATREQAIEVLRAPGVHAGAWTERASALEAAKRASALAHRLRDVPVEVDRTGRLLVEGLAAAVTLRSAEQRAVRGVAAPLEQIAELGAALDPGGDAPEPDPGGRGVDDEAWMPHALERLLASARWIGEARTRPEIVRRLVALFDKLRLGEPSAEELGPVLRGELRHGAGAASSASGAIALDAMGQGARAARAVREICDAIAQAARDVGGEERPCTAAELYAELARAAAEEGIGPRGGAARAGAVRIDVPAGLAGLEHDFVVVTGLEARAYGGGATADDTLLGEALRAKLPSPSRPPSARERQASQRAELSWAVAGARAVAVSFTRGDESDPNDPHPLVRWAMARGARPRTEPASRVAPGASRLGARGAELVAVASGAPAPADIAERARIERARAAFFLDPRAPSDAYTGRVVLADDEALRAQLRAAVGGAAPGRPIAVTHIERAAGCAFAGFARRVLRVRRVEDLAESADARERGTLVHRALQVAFEALRDLPPGAEPAEQLAAARAAAEVALGLGEPMAPLRQDAVEKAIADALQVVVRAIETDDPVRFWLAERRFGAGEPAPWEALELPDGAAPPDDGDGPASLWVDGQIDRVDRSPDGRVVRVVDYKTGRLPDAEEQRRVLQLPLYAAVAARATGAGEVRALYVGVRQRGLVEEWPRSIEEQRALAGRSAEAARAARGVVLALWEGRIAPRPARATICARCDARDVCRRPAVVPVDEGAEDRA